ncbi:hypothetical protein [Mycolicibacterium moriokaense]|uniref:Uncharacterized protein n=1 Tax=Mycolicibacterium moriokaense TaxID=39691 RepID=A0A318HK28_9MYCO|nr:hypothetical protein [Mycolicibacterium moriokaense]PXX06318.1 hypothetical protein C8E89_11491 [Mycolicibacterium moriokaense]
METLFRLPMVVRAVIYAAAGFAVAYLACLAWDFDGLYNEYNASRMGGWLVVAALICVLVTGYLLGADRRLQRDFGSTERFIAYKRSLRTGELPARINPDVWRGWLRLSRGCNRIAQLLAYLAVVFVVVPSLTRQPVYHPMFASLVGLLALWRLFSSGKRRARIARLAADVERHAGAGMTPEEAQLEIWFRRPLAVRVLLPAAIGFSFAFVVAGMDRLYHAYSGSLVGPIVWAAVVGQAVAVRTVMRLRPNFSSFEQYIAYTRALRTGELPALIEPGVWRARLRSSRRPNRMEPLWASLLVVFGVLPSLISQSAYWVTALFFGLAANRMLISWWRTRAQINWLAAEIERRDAGAVTVFGEEACEIREEMPPPNSVR